MQPNHLITQYIAQGDFDIANRYLLDLALSTANITIMQQATKASMQFRANNLIEWQKTVSDVLEQLHVQIKPAKEVLINAENVSKVYRKFTLAPTNLVLESGKIIGLVGENGNGKTTLLTILASELASDSGKVSYPIMQQLDTYDLQQHIAYIPQRIPKWYGNLKDNLHFNAAIFGLHGEANTAYVNIVLERLNITKYADLTWEQISSGYRTRFEIARILLKCPKILILDEPLANLDIKAQETILTDLKMMAKIPGKEMGILLSSQQLHEVEKIADEILFVQQGKFISDQEIKKINQQYTAIVEIETDVPKEALQDLFANCTINFNGSVYIIYSTSSSADEILQQLVQHNIMPKYFRNISNSTKSLFYATI
jgi:ABC-2 type transport system ATP-binding protein